MLDLYNIKYDRQTLKEHIYSLKLMDILKTQHLDLFFIVRYILSDLYQLHDEDKKIDVDLVYYNVILFRDINDLNYATRTPLP